MTFFDKLKNKTFWRKRWQYFCLRYGFVEPNYHYSFIPLVLGRSVDKYRLGMTFLRRGNLARAYVWFLIATQDPHPMGTYKKDAQMAAEKIRYDVWRSNAMKKAERFYKRYQKIAPFIERKFN